MSDIGDDLGAFVRARNSGSPGVPAGRFPA